MTDLTIPNIIKNEDNFLIVSHINPDGDAIGSLLGMYLALREMGKTAWPLSGEKFPELYDFLPGVDSVVTATQSGDMHPQWIIALDVASKPRISGDIEGFLADARLINIDHHGTNPGYGSINLIDSTATSTAELVFRVLSQSGYRLSADVGKCLYTGLLTDTGCFRFSGVNSGTLTLAAQLLEPGVDSYEVTRYLYEEYPLSRLELERLVLSRIEILLQGKLALSTLHHQDFQKLGAPLSEGENLVDRLRETRGVEVGVLMTQVSEDVVRVSFRSKGIVDVASIAASFGGGGHRSAAGLRSLASFSDLKRQIVAAIGKAIG